MVSKIQFWSVLHIDRKKCWEEEMSAAKCPCHELTLTDTDTQNINCSEPSIKKPCYKSDTTYHFMIMSLMLITLENVIFSEILLIIDLSHAGTSSQRH